MPKNSIQGKEERREILPPASINNPLAREKRTFWLTRHFREPKNVDKKNASIEAKEKSVGDIEDGIPQGVKTLKRISGHVLGIINEVIEVEVNSMVYRVRVLKIGFKDDTRSVSIMKKGQEVVNQNVSHQAESSSERSRSSSPELTEKQLPLTEDFNAMFLGKERNEECFYEAMILNRHMGE
ncbi:hypothetical protein V6N12_023003 [Hibiscus sabdariffa]|uniref:Uncharacterized protein n=1 Tax=Hibiscus sabdariffa TaxID=183260 RepID=A0ABR2FWE7_9ROSI